jgi:hypothetical protein
LRVVDPLQGLPHMREIAFEALHLGLLRPPHD